MAHIEEFAFVQGLRRRHPHFFEKTKVLEVGSLDVNGSIRQFFSGCDYTGIDLGEGPGVDEVVESGHLFTRDAGMWDVVCSCNCFEHNPFWIETWLNMLTLVRPGGLVFFTVPSPGRQEHGTIRYGAAYSPLTIAKGWGEYYKNLSEEDFRGIFDPEEHFSRSLFSTNNVIFDLYFYGVKRLTSC